MNPEFIFTKNGNCQHCKTPASFVLKKNLAVSGAEMLCWVCQSCDARNPDKSPQHWVKREQVLTKLTEDEIQNLPVIMPQIYTRCAVCGARATETHHWAPRAIFGSDVCDKWPTDQLCKKHHDEWHKLVTPQLVKKEFS